VIRGVKVRGGANVVQRWGVEAIKMAKEVGRAAGYRSPCISASD